MSSKTKLIMTLSLFAVLMLFISPHSQIAEASLEQATTYQITLPAASFVPNESANYTRSSHALQSNQTDGFFYAPVTLPDGATLRKIYIFYIDNNTIGQINADFQRVRLSNGNIDTPATVYSSYSGASWMTQMMTLQVAKIVNRYHTYTIRLMMDDNCSIRGVRIEYSVP